MTKLLPLALAAVFAGTALPAFAQSWEGGYFGIHAGNVQQDEASNETVLFDTNLDGNFGDTVNTAAPANAFSPGFCSGTANSAVAANGCRGDDDSDADYGLRAGYDWQRDNLVFGLVGEYSRGGPSDSVSAFSTTPAFYTMRRDIDSSFALRARVGFTFGDGDNLLYGTAGYAWAKVENRFTTSNGVNTFVDNGDSDATGMQFGIGYERRFADQFTVGLEYLVSELEDDEYRVRAQGPAPATNPFIRVNPNGTDFRRSGDDIDLGSLRMTLNWRF